MNINGINNLSAFFGGNTGGLGGINLGDYAALKSGSYRKLVKSYYNKQNLEGVTATNKKDKVKKQNVDTTGLKAMKTEADSLKTATSALLDNATWKKTGDSLDMDKVTSAVQKFADEYNSVVSQSKKVTNSDVAMQTRFMTSMTNTMSNALSSVGVKLDSEGKMTVDAEALKSADQKKVASLFSGKNSYASQIDQYASSIASAAMRNSSLYTNAGVLENSFSSIYNQQT